MEKIYNSNNYTIEVLYHIGAYENSIHFIFDEETKTCAIVDPAWEPDLFLKKIEDKGYTLTDIWITHWHGDHTNAVDDLANKTGSKNYRWY
jgi:glyoxylase-like metal-dependent hydrolase (beta-lactamase superfamily II)